MKQLTVTIWLLFFIFTSWAQTPVGTWSDHLVYNTARYIAVSPDEVYASTGSSVLVYNKSFAELRKLSPVTGLTETGISSIAWSEQNKALIIAYSSTNVDLFINNTYYNIPDINRAYIAGRKEIYRIRTNGRYAYLLSSFGIIVVDIIKREIHDTWKPGPGSEQNEVRDIAFGNGKIYAATGMGVYTAEQSNPGLSYYGNWGRLNSLPFPQAAYSSAIYTGNKFYVNMPDPGGSTIYNADEASVFSFEPGVHNSSLDNAVNSSGFTVTSTDRVRYYNDQGVLQKMINGYDWGTANISHAIAEDDDVWIADISSGLVYGSQMSVFTRMVLPGPLSNDIFHINSGNGKTLISGGGINTWWTNLNRPLEVSVFENNTWKSITSTTINDAMRSITNPVNRDHMFVATWGGGLLEYKNNILVNQYSYQNSPLQTIIPGQPYVRICGMAFDKDGLLWITQTQVPGSVKVLKPDGQWIVNPLTIETPTVGDLIITATGKKWIVLPRGPGLYVLDDNGTPEIFTDDRKKMLIVKDTENKTITTVLSIAEDLDGNIWVGTDQGPLIYYNPDKVFDEDLKAFRIKAPRNDGSQLSDIVLVTETITTISVDGANRKWLGTNNSGAYLLSPDGLNLIHHFNEQNSPILSNTINSLAIDNKTGDVWFGTTAGVVSYRGNATTGEEKFSKVYTFPNPVREDFTGNVTITGLLRDTQIRITDISGNLVYETESDGGEATWNLSTYNGKRVSTGVYLVFCASKDGTQSTVTKMLVIR
jgi:hypothetical protein